MTRAADDIKRRPGMELVRMPTSTEPVVIADACSPLEVRITEPLVMWGDVVEQRLDFFERTPRVRRRRFKKNR